MKKILVCFLLILGFLVAGCGGSGDALTEESSVDSSTEESSTVVSEESSENISEESEESSAEESFPDAEPKEPANLNLLTGIGDLTENAIGKRPVAVMVNNVAAAMPQYGIDKADIIYEMPVEGYQTRLMCIYADYTQLPLICSVRSCRKYFPAVARGYNAVYVNCGQFYGIDDYVDSLGVDQYDGRFFGTHLFAKDQERLDAGYKKEHTLYFNGPNFPAQLAEDKVDMNLEADKLGATAFKFCGINDFVTPAGVGCTDIYIDFGSNKSGFIYDSETKTYKKLFYNRKVKDDVIHADGKSGVQLEFANLFILHNDVAFDKDVVYNAEGDMHRLVKWQGGENSVGYYISGGVKQEIYWIKESESDMIRFYDKNGNEITVNRGKTYICFTDTEDVTFK
ncbi:MAG: DUF3048 domain-containing protein [Clostridia bacterium]|nr:DUF3048 domain-containing protein [Clostridia bacterium]